MRRALLPTSSLLVAVFSVCCEKEGPDMTKVYPAPRLAALKSSNAGVIRYAATTSGAVDFALGDSERRAEGTLPVARGWLSVDAADLRTLQGKLRLDASRIRLHGTEPIEGEARVASALGLADDSTSTEMSFSITGVKSATDLRARPSESRASNDLANERFATVVVRGDLELHGRRAEREVELEVVLRVVENRADGAPSHVSVRSIRPWRLSLTPFGFPRAALGDASGKLFESAQITIRADFMATP